MSETENQSLKELSAYKSYVIGILKSTGTTQQPIFRKSITKNGAALRKQGIKTIADFTENKRHEFTPNQTYVIYDIDDTDAGRLTFWGQFTADLPPEPKRQKPHGLSSLADVPQSPNQSQYNMSQGIGLYAQSPSAIDNSSRSAHSMRESFDRMLAEKQSQLDYNNQVRDREITSLKESHKSEIERIIDTKNGEILTLENQFGRVEDKYDKLLGEYYILQNANSDLTSRIAQKEGELKSEKDDHFKRMQILEAEYKTREELYGQELNLKHQRSAGLNDSGGTMGGVVDMITKLQPLISLWMNSNNNSNASAQQPTVTAQGTPQPPPPRPIRPSLPAMPSEQPQQPQQEVIRA